MSDKKSQKRKMGEIEESIQESPKKQKTEVTEGQGKGQTSLVLQIKEARENLCSSVAEFKFNKKRVRVLSKVQDFPDGKNGVLYWMSRDQRVQGELHIEIAPRILANIVAII